MLLQAALALAFAGGNVNLVPNRASTAPDYFCTWNIQGYACSYTGGPATRALIDEASLFGKGAYQNWLDFYPRVRRDLLFVMDDSWDVPPNGDEHAFARLQLDEEKFPGFKGSAVQRMAALTRAVKKQGWRGLGGWVCAQECPLLPARPMEAYWEDRLRELSSGGMSYLKVDWGKHDRDVSWRELLAKVKPAKMTVEAAMTPEALRFADTYRTYDVETIISAPETLDRLAKLFGAPEAKGSPTILNCEDEVYIGAALGCAYGIMRHPFAGTLPDGRQDFVFPPTCRDLKHRLDEVTRAVRWHRIAPPFPADATTFVRSLETLTDKWTMGENESYVSHPLGSTVSASAPAVLARGLPLPQVKCEEAEPPFVAAARYPNGCVSVAAIGRGLGRIYRTPLADVRLEGAQLKRPVGVFGHFRNLALSFPSGSRPKSVWAQDLASDRSVDITGRVKVDGNVVVVPGEVIEQVGLSAAHRDDVSDPGLVILVK